MQNPTRYGMPRNSPMRPTTLRTAERDTRLDVVRGIALVMIFINHVPGQTLENWTSKNFGFSDAAEAFVLLSGLSVGLAYGRKFAAGERLAVTAKTLGRALKLYAVHLLTTFVTLTLFVAGAWYFARPDLLEQINLAPVVDDLHNGIPAVLLLTHQLGYNNILPLYASLLLATPLILMLESRNPALLLMLSAMLWLAAGLFHWAPGNAFDDNVWFFNPLSWQFLFVIGIVAIMYVKRGGSIPRHPLLLCAALAYAILALFWVTQEWWFIDLSFGLPSVLTGFDKTFLSLPRLLHVLALAYLVVSVAPLSQMLRRPYGNPIAVLGRHSLVIFTAGTILSMVGQVLLMVSENASLLGPVFVIAGILFLFALAQMLEDRRPSANTPAWSRPRRADPAARSLHMPIPARFGL